MHVHRRNKSRWSRLARNRSRTAHAISFGAGRARDKSAWFVAAGIGAVIAAFGVVLNSVHAVKVEQQSLTCLALNVYFEARGEPQAGRYAVAEVTLNRVASPYYPDSVCAVVYQQNWDPLRSRYVAAFSWTELETLPAPRGKEWREAWQVAEEVYYRRRQPSVGAALHYHADYIKPSWSRHREPLARIGNHVFYR